MSAAVDRVADALRSAGKKPSKTGSGYSALCPAHQDATPSLSIWEGKMGWAKLKCHAGCNEAAILLALGLQTKDLAPAAPHQTRHTAPGSMKDSAPEPTPRAAQSLAQFCAERHLDAERLTGRWRVAEKAHKGRRCLQYPTTLGVDRVKYLDGAKPKYCWVGPGGRAHWYGMGSATKLGGPVLYILGGEPSVWACEQEGVSAVCPCGESVKPSQAMIEDLKGSRFARFAVVYDLDGAGRKGGLAVADALRAAGLDAVALALPDNLGEGGDVDDLHRRVGAGLGATLAELPEINPPEPAGPILKAFSEIEPEEVSWLWEPYIPKGKLVLFQGDPSAGKTWAALSVCARLTQEGHKAVYASLEDGLGDTLRPRAEKVGVVLSRLYALMGRREEDGGERHLTLADTGDIEKALVKWEPAVLVLDPISAWLQGADMNKANEVRGKLTPVVRLAEKYGVTVLILQHLTKARTDRAIYRGQGSIDFVAAARSVLLFGKAQGGQSAMIQIKNSLGPYGKSIGYTIGEAGFEWTGENELTAADLLEGEAGPDERGAHEDALEWLRAELASSPQEAKTLQERFERETGHNKRTLRRALATLGGAIKREGFGPSGKWIWSLSSIGDKTSPKGTRAQNLVPYAETTAPKGLQGHCSTIGDKEYMPVPNEEGATGRERFEL